MVVSSDCKCDGHTLAPLYPILVALPIAVACDRGAVERLVVRFAVDADHAFASGI